MPLHYHPLRALRRLMIFAGVGTCCAVLNVMLTTLFTLGMSLGWASSSAWIICALIGYIAHLTITWGDVQQIHDPYSHDWRRYHGRQLSRFILCSVVLGVVNVLLRYWFVDSGWPLLHWQPVATGLSIGITGVPGILLQKYYVFAPAKKEESASQPVGAR